MKARILISLLICSAAILSSCRKSTWLSSNHFVFGKVGELGQELYMLRKGKLYRSASTDRMITSGGAISFKGKPVSGDVHAADQLRNSLPADLAKQPNGLIGCPGCADGHYYYVEVEKNGDKSWWLIDPSDPSSAAVNEYIARIETRVADLR